MATIKLNRTNEYNNRIRDYKIYLNKELIGTISNGETKEFNVKPGNQEIYAKIDWCYSPTLKIELNDNETLNLKVGGFKNGIWIMPISISIILIHFILSFLFKFNYLIFLVIPVFLLMIYYISIGRKNYLTLNKI